MVKNKTILKQHLIFLLYIFCALCITLYILQGPYWVTVTQSVRNTPAISERWEVGAVGEERLKPPLQIPPIGTLVCLKQLSKIITTVVCGLRSPSVAEFLVVSIFSPSIIYYTYRILELPKVKYTLFERQKRFRFAEKYLFRKVCEHSF